MTVSSPSPPPPPKKPRGRWFKVRVVIAAVLLVTAFAVYLNGRNQGPPRVLAILSQGRSYLDVPVMTFYTFPELNASNYWVRTNYSFGRSTIMTFNWTAVDGSSLPVRFVLSSSGPFQAVSSGGFTFSLGWLGGSGAIRPGTAGVEVTSWVMDYVIREMAVYDWLGEDHWIEVDYSLTSPSACLCSLPAANTSAASPADMVPVLAPFNLTVVGSNILWGWGTSIDQVTPPPGVFRRTLPSLHLSLAGLGNLSATLSSSFRWSSGDNYEMQMGGSGPASVHVQLYLDERFGSLLAEALV